MIAILEGHRIVKHLVPPEWAYASDLRWVTVGLFLIAVVVNFMVWRSAVHDLHTARATGRQGPTLAAGMLSGDEFLRLVASCGLLSVSAMSVYLAIPVPGLALAQTVILALIAVLMAGKSIRMWVLRRRLKDLPSTSNEWTGVERRRTDPDPAA